MQMSPYQRRFLAAVVAAGAGSLLLIGLLRGHKVYEAGAAGFGLLSFQRIAERQLVIDATFSGVLRRGVRLHSTYDRTVTRGKRACPS